MIQEVLHLSPKWISELWFSRANCDVKNIFVINVY